MPENILDVSITRRSVLGAGLAVGAGLALAACGVGSGTSTSSPAAPNAMRTPPMPSTGAAAPTPSGQLNFVGFEGDDLVDILKPWYEKYGVKLNSNYQSAEGQTLQRLLGPAGKGTDLTSLTAAYTQAFVQADVLMPLDPNKIPNLVHLRSFLKEDTRGYFTDVDGNWVALPQYWGGLGLLWDTAVLPNGMTSWNDVLDPKLNGKLCMVDFPEFNMWAAAQAVGGGIDTGKMSKEQLQQIVDWLTPVAAQVKTFSPSFGDIITLMAAGEVAAVMPGFGFLVNSAAEAGRKSFEVTDVIREGAVGAVEVLGIPKGASNPDAAYAFLNQMLERDVHVQIAKLQSSAGVVDTIDDLLDAQFRKENHVDEAEQYWKSLAFFTSAPFKSDTYVTQGQMFDAWAKIKASAGQ